MNLKQIRYLCEIVDQGFSISQASLRLHTSQPGISKQIQLLENDLGTKLLDRKNTRIVGLTKAGTEILPVARRMLLDADVVRHKVREVSGEDSRRLTIATTHTHARYSVLPAFQAYRKNYPDVKLELLQANATGVAEIVALGKADIGIAMEPLLRLASVKYVPCYRIDYGIAVPLKHPLLNLRKVQLEDIARHPIITYDSTFPGGLLIQRQFDERRIRINIAINAIDSDISKAYVEAGFGVSILPLMVWEPKRDIGLRMIPVPHLFNSTLCDAMTLEGQVIEPYKLEFISYIRTASAGQTRKR